jgi:hypothetical protein
VSNERERPDPDIPQDPGIPGSKVPEELPPEKEPHVEKVPDTGPPDTDDEGHMTPPADSSVSRTARGRLRRQGS